MTSVRVTLATGTEFTELFFAECDVCYCVGEGYSVLFRDVVKKGREAVF